MGSYPEVLEGKILVLFHHVDEFGGDIVEFLCFRVDPWPLFLLMSMTGFHVHSYTGTFWFLPNCNHMFNNHMSGQLWQFFTLPEHKYINT